MAGSAPSNSSAVDFEKQQAAEADAKEAQRQANLTQGQAAIDAIFNPQPVMGTKTSNYDWSQFQAPTGAVTRDPSSIGGYSAGKPTGVPAGYTAVQIPGQTAGAAMTSGGRAGAAAQLDPSRYNPATSSGDTTFAVGGAGRGALPAAPSDAGGTGGAGGGSTWGLQDASGKIYKQGDPLSVTSQYDTGKTTGGFGDDFYNAFNQKVLDYYNPQEEKQYGEAKRDLTYSLARSGNLVSSAAGDATGQLAYQDALHKANIVANANSQTGQLQSQIAQNKSNLINQLYATDDPSLANEQAETSAKASQLQDPTLTPMASLFTPIVTGATGAIQNATSPYKQVQTGVAPVQSALANSSKLNNGVIGV